MPAKDVYFPGEILLPHEKVRRQRVISAFVKWGYDLVKLHHFMDEQRRSWL